MNARDRACFDKRRYWSETDALIVGQKRESSGSPKLRAYKCKWCSGWHLTKVRQHGKEETQHKEADQE